MHCCCCCCCAEGAVEFVIVEDALPRAKRWGFDGLREHDGRSRNHRQNLVVIVGAEPQEVSGGVSEHREHMLAHEPRVHELRHHHVHATRQHSATITTAAAAATVCCCYCRSCCCC